MTCEHPIKPSGANGKTRESTICFDFQKAEPNQTVNKV